MHKSRPLRIHNSGVCKLSSAFHYALERPRLVPRSCKPPTIPAPLNLNLAQPVFPVKPNQRARARAPACLNSKTRNSRAALIITSAAPLRYIHRDDRRAGRVLAATGLWASSWQSSSRCRAQAPDSQTLYYSRPSVRIEGEGKWGYGTARGRR